MKGKYIKGEPSHNIDDNIDFQAKYHPPEKFNNFSKVEEYIVHLMHLKAYKNIIPNITGMKVLEIGCNNGWGTRFLSDYASSIKGIDVSSSMIELAQKSYEKDNIEFNVTNGIRHNYDSKSFNVVVSFQVLEHVYDYSIYLSEISRLLDDGGYCFFTTPNAMMRLKQGMTPWNKYHVKEFNSLELDELLSQYYSKVEIVGLFGDSKTYPIEFNRISNNREYALRQNSLYYRFKGKIGNLLKKLYQNKSNINKIKIELSQNVMDEFSTENFYFSKDNLDNCFDFFAFCKK